MPGAKMEVPMTKLESASEVVLGPRPITLVRPIIGFEEDRRYVLSAISSELAPYLALRAERELGPRFIVVAPGLLFPDYVVEVPEQDAALLRLDDPADAEVLVLVTHRRAELPTVNLLGPLVVNWAAGTGAQIVLVESSYGVAVPIDRRSACAAA